jgi:hypothetical protein
LNERSSRWRALGDLTWCGIAVLCAVVSGAPLASAQSGTIAGQVVDKLTGLALPYSSISIVGRPGERFAADSGRFRLTDVPAGSARLRVRHVGYTPLEQRIDVVARGTTTVLVALTRAPVTLAAVHVNDGRCTAPGAPRGGDSSLATIFQQLQLNAEQYELVTKDYPFTSLFSRRYSHLVELLPRREPGTALTVKIDTTDIATRIDSVVVRSDDPWHYKPGGVVTEESTAGFSARAVEIPTLAVFTDPAFVGAHCFWNAGFTEVDGRAFRQIDFRAADNIAEPDLDGSIFLDSATYVIGRSVVSLTRAAAFTASYDSVVVETEFREVVPGVPIIAGTDGRNVVNRRAGMDAGPNLFPRGRRLLSDVERQRLEQIRFLHGAPGSKSGPKALSGLIRVSTAGERGRVLGVYDSATGAPLADAVVYDSLSGITVFTTARGLVKLAFVPGTRAVLTVEHVGYVTLTTPVSLSPDDTTPVAVMLRRVP